MVQFYDVKTRQTVDVPESQLTKKKYTRTTKSGSVQVRYAIRAKTSDGRNLTKFVSKEYWDSLSVPEE